METKNLYSSNFNLLMLNVWLGMCKGAQGLPRDLRRLGYQDHSIEFGFSNSKGRKVVPELIVGSEQLSHSVLLEWKKGANLEEDQLSRYGEVTPDDLRTKAFIPVASCSTHDACIVGKEEHNERLKTGLADYAFPLILVSESAMWLTLNHFRHRALDDVFTPRLLVDLQSAPISFVPFNEESESWQVAEIVMPYVVSKMVKREPMILLEEVCNTLIVGWNTVAADKKPKYRGTVKEVLTEASKNEFRRYLQKNIQTPSPKRTEIWDIKNNPLDLSSSKRSREFRRLQSAQERFINALRTGRRPNLQEELF